MSRKSKGRKPEKRILVICASEKTEPIYFDAYRKHLKSTGIHIEGMTIYSTKAKYQLPSKLLEFALLKMKEYDLDIASGDTIWCIFDFDDFGKNIRESVIKKKYRNIEKIVSSRCFELWYLLHFEYTTSHIQRTEDLEKALTRHFGNRYEKNKNYFDQLNKHQETAIDNAKRLERFHEENGCKPYEETYNPSTNVYKLVTFLNNMKIK